MKKLYTSTSIVLLQSLIAVNLFAQWCVPTTAIPYSTNMPGITNVTVGTINRTSLAIENYPANSYVNTGLSTTFVQGQSYTISITHTRDAVIFPTVPNNLRVWIDFNHDFQLDDPGETMVSLNNQPYGTTTATFTIPSTAPAGATRMRITAKMGAAGGHAIPTPCDIPADPLGYHGEIEDYDVTIASASGIDEHGSANSFTVINNVSAHEINIGFNLLKPAKLSLTFYSLEGEKVFEPILQQSFAAGDHTLNYNISNAGLSNGIYFVRIISDDYTVSRKIAIAD